MVRIRMEKENLYPRRLIAAPRHWPFRTVPLGAGAAQDFSLLTYRDLSA